MNEELILNIARKMGNVWNGYNTDFEITVIDGEIIERNHEEQKQRVLTPETFIIDWAETILLDYHKHGLRYANEEEIKYISEIKTKGGNNMKLNEAQELINVKDNIFGRVISTEHMIDLIVANENDKEFERGELHDMTVAEARKEVENNLEYYMKRHDYEWL